MKIPFNVMILVIQKYEIIKIIFCNYYATLWEQRKTLLRQTRWENDGKQTKDRPGSRSKNKQAWKYSSITSLNQESQYLKITKQRHFIWIPVPLSIAEGMSKDSDGSMRNGVLWGRISFAFLPKFRLTIASAMAENPDIMIAIPKTKK